ncbi:MAG: 6-phosphogluconolactonase [Firmicutes bacterium]|nr:6-phosphogluconolactonase [Bacillota bacterium]
MAEQHVEVHVHDNAADVVVALANWLHDQVSQDIQAHGFSSLALPGGHTPATLYQHLAAEQQRWPWSHLRLYLGDERQVPPTDFMSNFRMIREHLLDHLTTPPASVYPWPTLLSVPDCLASYRQQLALLPQWEGYPQLDIALLGMGDDGHTASVFPDSPQYHARDWVAYGPGPSVPRFTMTLPLLSRAHHVIFLVTGLSKAARVRECLKDPSASLPAALLTRQAHDVHWFLDRESASAL